MLLVFWGSVFRHIHICVCFVFLILFYLWQHSFFFNLFYLMLIQPPHPSYADVKEHFSIRFLSSYLYCNISSLLVMELGLALWSILQFLPLNWGVWSITIANASSAIMVTSKTQSSGLRWCWQRDQLWILALRATAKTNVQTWTLRKMNKGDLNWLQQNVSNLSKLETNQPRFPRGQNSLCVATVLIYLTPMSLSLL